MKFSIIIPAYKRPAALKKTVSSILMINKDIDHEIIIVNDAPKHPVADFGDNRVRIIVNEKNLGRSSSRNKGGLAAKGDVVFFIDDDIEVKEDMFTRHLDLIDNGFDAVFSNVINKRTDGSDTALNRFLNTRGMNNKPAGKVKSNYFTTAFCSLKREFFEEIGMFDENFKGYGWEDPEIGIRIDSSGGKTGFVKTGSLIHYHDKSIEEWVSQIEKAGKNLRYLIEKHPQFAKTIKKDLLNSLPVRFAFNDIFFRIGIIKAKIFGDFLWLMFRYLFYGAVSRSLRK